MKRALVVTTISKPNRCLQSLSEGAQKHEVEFIVVGDMATPTDFTLPHCQFYDIERQSAEFPQLCAVLPTKHYARKNIGYLVAMAHGVSEIQETDDDNFPLNEAFWELPPQTEFMQAVQAKGWFNVYAHFSRELIWPRGLPLEYIRKSTTCGEFRECETRNLIVQGLANGNPDVDAIYRMTQTLPFEFDRRPPVVLLPGTWCPFNSQNTIFRKECFPLLYLPSNCSFRMTDIWRSFVAQRCLWEIGEGVVFRSATAYQERNEHNLLKDFEEEVPGYLHNDKIRIVLDALKLDGNDLTRSLTHCYEALISAEYIPASEMPILREWVAAFESAE
jgi:STELLO glycosyltransferases